MKAKILTLGIPPSANAHHVLPEAQHRPMMVSVCRVKCTPSKMALNAFRVPHSPITNPTRAVTPASLVHGSQPVHHAMLVSMQCRTLPQLKHTCSTPQMPACCPARTCKNTPGVRRATRVCHACPGNSSHPQLQTCSAHSVPSAITRTHTARQRASTALQQPTSRSRLGREARSPRNASVTLGTNHQVHLKKTRNVSDCCG